MDEIDFYRKKKYVDKKSKIFFYLVKKNHILK